MKKAVNYLLAACLMLGLTACGPANNFISNPNRKTDNKKTSIEFVFDNSGSMSSRMDGAKEALYKTLGTLKEYNDSHHNLEAGIVAFNRNEPQIVAPLREFNYSNLSNAVYGITLDIDTPLGPAIETAKNELEFAGSGIEHIISCTDGEANIGKSPLEVYKNILDFDHRNGRTPTKLHIIGFGYSPDYKRKIESLGARTYKADGTKELEGELLGITEKILLEDPEVPKIK